MDMNDSFSGNTATGETRGSAKKPYEKPAFRHEKVFVTTALSCGKIGPTSMSCSSNMQAS